MTLGRPLEFDPDVALELAMCLFWRKGYESTSLQDLLGEMGISKSSFYQTFESKRALFLRCLDLYRQRTMGDLKRALEAAPSGMAFIEGAFHGVAQGTSGPQARMGCLLMNTASEFSQRDPEIARLVAESLDEFADLFEEAVRRAQADGELPTDKDPKALAVFLVSSVGGARNMVKAGVTRAQVETITRVALSALA